MVRSVDPPDPRTLVPKNLPNGSENNVPEVKKPLLFLENIIRAKLDIGKSVQCDNVKSYESEDMPLLESSPLLDGADGVPASPEMPTLVPFVLDSEDVKRSLDSQRSMSGYYALNKENMNLPDHQSSHVKTMSGTSLSPLFLSSTVVKRRRGRPRKRKRPYFLVENVAKNKTFQPVVMLKRLPPQPDLCLDHSTLNAEVSAEAVVKLEPGVTNESRNGNVSPAPDVPKEPIGCEFGKLDLSNDSWSQWPEEYEGCSYDDFVCELDSVVNSPVNSPVISPEVDMIDGVEFLSFLQEGDVNGYALKDNQTIVFPSDTDMDSCTDGVGSVKDEHPFIVPTKTKDITQIKGWKHKLFLGDHSESSRLSSTSPSSLESDGAEPRDESSQEPLHLSRSSSSASSSSSSNPYAENSAIDFDLSENAITEEQKNVEADSIIECRNKLDSPDHEIVNEHDENQITLFAEQSFKNSLRLPGTPSDNEYEYEPDDLFEEKDSDEKEEVQEVTQVGKLDEKHELVDVDKPVEEVAVLDTNESEKTYVEGNVLLLGEQPDVYGTAKTAAFASKSLDLYLDKHSKLQIDFLLKCNPLVSAIPYDHPVLSVGSLKVEDPEVGRNTTRKSMFYKKLQKESFKYRNIMKKIAHIKPKVEKSQVIQTEETKSTGSVISSDQLKDKVGVSKEDEVDVVFFDDDSNTSGGSVTSNVSGYWERESSAIKFDDMIEGSDMFLDSSMRRENSEPYCSDKEDFDCEKFAIEHYEPITYNEVTLAESISKPAEIIQKTVWSNKDTVREEKLLYDLLCELKSPDSYLISKIKFDDESPDEVNELLTEEDAQEIAKGIYMGYDSLVEMNTELEKLKQSNSPPLKRVKKRRKKFRTKDKTLQDTCVSKPTDGETKVKSPKEEEDSRTQVEDNAPVSTELLTKKRRQCRLSTRLLDYSGYQESALSVLYNSDVSDLPSPSSKPRELPAHSPTLPPNIDEEPNLDSSAPELPAHSPALPLNNDDQPLDSDSCNKPMDTSPHSCEELRLLGSPKPVTELSSKIIEEVIVSEEDDTEEPKAQSDNSNIVSHMRNKVSKMLEENASLLDSANLGAEVTVANNPSNTKDYLGIKLRNGVHTITPSQHSTIQQIKMNLNSTVAIDSDAKKSIQKKRWPTSMRNPGSNNTLHLIPLNEYKWNPPEFKNKNKSPTIKSFIINTPAREMSSEQDVINMPLAAVAQPVPTNNTANETIFLLYGSLEMLGVCVQAEELDDSAKGLSIRLGNQELFLSCALKLAKAPIRLNAVIGIVVTPLLLYPTLKTNSPRTPAVSGAATSPVAPNTLHVSPNVVKLPPKTQPEVSPPPPKPMVSCLKGSSTVVTTGTTTQATQAGNLNVSFLPASTTQTTQSSAGYQFRIVSKDNTKIENNPVTTTDSGLYSFSRSRLSLTKNIAQVRPVQHVRPLRIVSPNPPVPANTVPPLPVNTVPPSTSPAKVLIVPPFEAKSTGQQSILSRALEIVNAAKSSLATSQQLPPPTKVQTPEQNHQMTAPLIILKSPPQSQPPQSLATPDKVQELAVHQSVDHNDHPRSIQSRTNLLLQRAAILDKAVEDCKTHSKSTDPAESDSSLEEPDREFTCDLCNKSFSRRYSLNRHKQKHARDSDRINSYNRFFSNLTCRVCQKIFPKKSIMMRHIREDHDMAVYLRSYESLSRPKGKFVCNLCNMSFEFEYSLKRHMADHDKPPAPAYSNYRLVGSGRILICPLCCTLFTNIALLDRHMKIHGNAVEVPGQKFPCILCHQFFAEKSVLAIHVNNHYTPPDPAESDNSLEGSGHKCNLCYKLFSCKYSLAGHLKDHIKSGSCPVRTKVLIQHIFGTGPKAVEALPPLPSTRCKSPDPARIDNSLERSGPTVKCILCKKSFYNDLSLARHIRDEVKMLSPAQVSTLPDSPLKRYLTQRVGINKPLGHLPMGDILCQTRLPISEDTSAPEINITDVRTCSLAVFGNEEDSNTNEKLDTSNVSSDNVPESIIDISSDEDHSLWVSGEGETCLVMRLPDEEDEDDTPQVVTCS